MNQRKGQVQPDIPEHVSITNPSPAVRLRGSYSSPDGIQTAELAPGERRNDGPFTGEFPPPPPPPPPPVSTPDLALQIAYCLPSDIKGSLTSALREALGPGPEIRPVCVNGTQRVGIWLNPSVSVADDQARGRGIARLNIINDGETLAFFVNSSLIRRQATATWNDTPKRRNSLGQPEPNGPVHLTSFSLSFEDPNRIITRIDGFDERPWPDVDFRIAITDTLSVQGGVLRCESQRILDVDTNWLTFLSAIFYLVLPSPLAPVFDAELIAIERAEAPNALAGAGCSARDMVPQEILIPGGQKVVASYSRVQVSSGGIYVGGTFGFEPRAPGAVIMGPDQISVVEGTSSVTRNYSLSTTDLRPALQINWGGDGSALDPGAPTTRFRMNLAGAEVGDIVVRRVAVQVTDVDGLVGSAEEIVRIYVTPRPEIPSDDFPVVCRTKPWLPVCHEPLERLVDARRARSAGNALPRSESEAMQ